MIPFKSFRYIFPPRPENALPQEELIKYDNGKYIAQPKLNGDLMMVFTNGKQTILKNRHKADFKSIQITLDALYRETLDGTENKWSVLIGEYMIKSKKNSEKKVWNQKFVIFDIIVFDGIQLLGKTFSERIELLDKLYGKEEIALTKTGTYHDKFLYATSIENVFRVKSFTTDFAKIWNELVEIDMYEGLVLKRADAKLENGNSPTNNSGSQLKFRKSTKNYMF